MTTQPTHTPTPLEQELPVMVAKRADGKFLVVADHGAVTIAECIWEKDAAFIVRAVNAHEELLNGLKDALSFIRDDRQCLSKRCGHYEKSDCIDTFIADKIAKAEARS